MGIKNSLSDHRKSWKLLAMKACSFPKYFCTQCLICIVELFWNRMRGRKKVSFGFCYFLINWFKFWNVFLLIHLLLFFLLFICVFIVLFTYWYEMNSKVSLNAVLIRMKLLVTLKFVSNGFLDNTETCFLKKLFGKWFRETSSRPLFIFLKKPLTSWLVSVWLTLYQIDPVMSTDTHNIHRFK